MVISGDCLPINPKWAEESDLLVHEATFLGDSPEEAHSTVAQALAVWRESGASRLLLYHISSRFTKEEVAAELDQLLPNGDERAKVNFIVPGRLFSCELQLGGL